MKFYNRENKKKQQAELNSWVLDDVSKRKEKIERETSRYPLLREQMGLNIIDLSDKRILEIGGGPIGVIADVMCKSKVILDPLTEEYSKYWPCPHHLDGFGEDIPFSNDAFDVVVIVNSLDHCFYPEEVLEEVFRVLRPGGWLAIHNTINLASIHKGDYHTINLDENWFHNKLDYDYEIVHELNWTSNKLRYGWITNPYDGKVGQPSIALLARKVKGYE
jgi:SAM-dependent methyltransferase